MTTAELLEHLRTEAMKLPERERLQLVVELHETLGPGLPVDDDSSVSVSPAWDAEIRRRVAEVDAGAAGSRPYEDVIAEVKAGLLARRR